MEFNEKLKATRENLDITQEQAAEKIECTRHQYIRYEKGEQEMTTTKLKNTCLYYKVSADYLLGLPKGLEWPQEPKD